MSRNLGKLTFATNIYDDNIVFHIKYNHCSILEFVTYQIHQTRYMIYCINTSDKIYNGAVLAESLFFLLHKMPFNENSYFLSKFIVGNINFSVKRKLILQVRDYVF